MDWLKSLYPAVTQVLQDSIPDYWPQLRVILGTTCEQPMVPEAILPLAACQAVNGQAEDAVYVAAALVNTVASMRLLDDLEDQNRPGQLWEQVGPPRAWNYAAAAQFLSFEILNRAPLNPAIIHRISQVLGQAVLRIGAGQDRELSGLTGSIEEYWVTMEMRSGHAYAAACVSGAMVGTEDLTLIEACSTFGYHLGLAMQIFNDMESIWQPDGKSDLEQTKITLPVLYGLHIDHAERDELKSLVATHNLATHADRVRQILENVQTREFLIWAALKEREQALTALSICPDALGREALSSFVTGIFGDIGQLLA